MMMFLMMSIWPSFLVRDSLGEPVRMPNIQVESWVVFESVEKVQGALKKAPCQVISQPNELNWICVTEQKIYSWDYSQRPSLWSETSKLEQGGSGLLDKGIGSIDSYSYQWGKHKVTIKQSQRSLLQVAHDLNREISSEKNSQVFIREFNPSHLAVGWKVSQSVFWVTAWKLEEGGVRFLRVEQK